MPKFAVKMMIHHFNPEHEIALAHGISNFTPPHAATRLRAGLGWMPAIWADNGDVVLVDDEEYAHKAWEKWRGRKSNVYFLDINSLKRFIKLMSEEQLAHISAQPWGWDLPVRQLFIKAGLPVRLLPSLNDIRKIRHLAHRDSATPLLRYLKGTLPRMVGERCCLTTIEDIGNYCEQFRHIVLKSPWSSSGRGVRYVQDAMDAPTRSWASRIIRRQGAIIAEPYYDHIIDFAIELAIHPGQGCRYLGLSLFETVGGNYKGNWLATEAMKLERLSRYIAPRLLDRLIREVTLATGVLLQDHYKGLLGIDMMIVKNGDGFLIHPCVEMNLRRTMGHVALDLAPSPLEPDSVLHITHGVNDELKTQLTDNPFVKVV